MIQNLEIYLSLDISFIAFTYLFSTKPIPESILGYF